jgi:hypothetical protein
MANVTNFFLGANSGDGFQSLFPQLMEGGNPYDLMILKGGPGTGKSLFMEQIGSAMEAAGTAVEYLRCSGDPDSLDGVLLPGLKCGLVDGTAPHVLEPRYPAAVERYVDLGRFYDLTAAKANREEMIGQTKAYRAADIRACHSLKAARQVELDVVAEAWKTMDWKRADRRAAGIIARELHRKGNEPGTTQYRFLGSITDRGYLWRFDSVDALCPRVYELADSYALAGGLLSRLRDKAAERGWNSIACVSPEEPSRLEHLLIPGLGLAFVTSKPGMEYGGKPFRHVRLDAMVSPKNRARLRFETRMTRLLREEAVASLREAKEAHDRLEDLYRPYVDADDVRALAAVETARLLSWLQSGESA